MSLCCVMTCSVPLQAETAVSQSCYLTWTELPRSSMASGFLEEVEGYNEVQMITISPIQPSLEIWQ